MACLPGFVATVPEPFWPEVLAWAQRGCKRHVVKHPVTLYGLRASFGTAADVSKLIRRRCVKAGLDVDGLPPDAEWLRAIDEAAFEAAEREAAAAVVSPPLPEGRVEPADQATFEAADREAAAPAVLPEGRVEPADQAEFEAAERVAAAAVDSPPLPEARVEPARSWPGVVHYPSPLSPDFLEKSQARLRELRAQQSASACAAGR